MPTRPPVRPFPWAAALLATILAACSAATGTSPGGSPGGDASPAPPTLGATSLRAWTTQALAPRETFGWLPSVTIADGLVISPGAMIMIYPGPLFPPLMARPIDEAGLAAIVDEARARGLLGERTDFTAAAGEGGARMAGGQTAHIEIVTDGERREIVGDPSRLMECPAGAACVPEPGTPQAFADFWSRIHDLQGWLGGALGPDAEYAPKRLSILVTEPAAADAGLVPQRLPWPLEQPLSDVGSPYAGSAGDRCATLVGADLDRLLAAVRQANQLTRWIDGTGNERGLVVRPLVPGEPDPCSPAS